MTEYTIKKKENKMRYVPNIMKHSDLVEIGHMNL
jgi:hypothetical protein